MINPIFDPYLVPFLVASAFLPFAYLGKLMVEVVLPRRFFCTRGSFFLSDVLDGVFVLDGSSSTSMPWRCISLGLAMPDWQKGGAEFMYLCLFRFATFLARCLLWLFGIYYVKKTIMRSLPIWVFDLRSNSISASLCGFGCAANSCSLVESRSARARSAGPKTRLRRLVRLRLFTLARELLAMANNVYEERRLEKYDVV